MRRIGDKILISGSTAVHGIAIMSVREGLEFESEIPSDTAALHGLVQAMIGAGVDIHVLLDATRVGGTRVVDMLSGEQLPRIC